MTVILALVMFDFTFLTIFHMARNPFHLNYTVTLYSRNPFLIQFYTKLQVSILFEFMFICSEIK